MRFVLKKDSLISFAVITLIWYFFCLYNLDKSYIFLWDEAHYALNTYDFIQHKNPFLVSVHGLPDWWNTKPPLHMIIQSASVYFFGFNEFGIRFPSALFALFTALLLLFFSKKVYSSYIPGILGGIILFSCQYYNGFHVARTGDVDSLLSFFIVGYVLFFYFILENKNAGSKLFIAFYLFVFAAFLTKSIAGLIALPAILPIILLHKKYYHICKQKRIYIGAIILIIASVSVILVREFFDSGYIKNALISTELSMFNRNNESVNVFREFSLFFTHKLSFYSLFLLLTIVITIIKSNTRQFIFYIISVATIFVFIHSYSNISRSWYTAPAIPLFCLAIGSLLHEVYTFSKNNLLLTQRSIIFSSIGLLLCFSLAYNYRIIIGNIYNEQSYHTELIDDVLSDFIKTKIATQKKYKTLTYYLPGNNTTETLSTDKKYSLQQFGEQKIKAENIYFYKYSLAGQNTQIDIKTSFPPKIGDTILLRKDYPEYYSIVTNKEVLDSTSMYSLFIY